MIDLKQAVDKLRSNEVPNPVAAQATSLSNNIVRLKKQWEKWVLEEFETATAGPTW